MLFLSYAEEDGNTGVKVAEWLVGQGLDVYYWQDPRRRGGRFIEEIEKAIGQADAFVALLSPSFVQSSWCRQERDLAMQRELDLRARTPGAVFIHVLKISDTPLEEAGFLRSYDWGDLTSPPGWEQALSGLADRLRHSARAPSAATSPLPGPAVAGPASYGHHDELDMVVRGLANASGGQVIVGEIPREPPAFVKREALDQLADAASSGQPAVVCAVTGLRGVGKTQLAAAYARDRIARGCRLVGWVNAESRDSLLGDLARVAEAAGVADPEGDSAESARRLRDHLTVRLSGSLLVLDNASDPDLIRPFLPAAGSTQVVITSTTHAFTDFGMPVDVSEFSRDESLGYLRIRTGMGDRDGAAEVADELGDLPLGLAQASAVIAGQRMTYQEYLQRLRQVPVARLLGRPPGGDYPRATAAALLLNVAAAEAGDLSGLADRLLRVVAVLSAEGARRRMLDGLSSGDRTAVGEALQRCVDQSLLTWSVTGEYVIMHRLLSRVIRERDKVSGQLAATREMAMDLLEPQLHNEGQAWTRREDGAELAAHIEAIWQAVAGDHGQP